MDKFLVRLQRYINFELNKILSFSDTYIVSYDKENNIIIISVRNKFVELMNDNDIYSAITKSILSKDYTNLNIPTLFNPTSNLNFKSKSNLSMYLSTNDNLYQQFKDVILKDIKLADSNIINLKLYVNTDDIIIELVRNEGTCYIDLLPKEIITLIFNQLSLNDGSRFKICNRNNTNILNNNINWYHQFIKECPTLFTNYINKYDYKKLLQNVVDLVQLMIKRDHTKPFIKNYKNVPIDTVTKSINYPKMDMITPPIIIKYNYYCHNNGELIEYIIYENLIDINIDTIDDDRNRNIITNILLMNLPTECLDIFCSRINYNSLELDDYELLEHIFNSPLIENIIKIKNVDPYDLLIKYVDYNKPKSNDTPIDIELRYLVPVLLHKDINDKECIKLIEYIGYFNIDIQNYLWDNYNHLIKNEDLSNILNNICDNNNDYPPNIELIMKICNTEYMKAKYLK